MEGMDPIDEVLERMDSAAMTLSYTIPRGLPLPLTDYRSTVFKGRSIAQVLRRCLLQAVARAYPYLAPLPGQLPGDMAARKAAGRRY